MSAANAKQADRFILEWITFSGRLVASAAFMSVAAALNLASAKERGLIMTGGSLALVAGAAFALHCLIHRPGAQKLFFALLFPVLISMSMFSAVRNIDGIRKTAEEKWTAHTEAKGDLKKQLTSLKERRKVQADIAGEEAPEVIQGRIDDLKARHIGKWNATDGCKPEQVASTEAKTLCNGVRELQIKLNAAKLRDKLQGKIDTKEAKAEEPAIAAPLGVPVSNEAVLYILSFVESDNVDGSKIDYAFEIGFVLAMELLAAGAPLMFGLRLSESRQRRIEAAEAEERRKAEAEARIEAEAKAERAAKRAEAKTRAKGDPATVERFVNSNQVTCGPSHVVSQSEVYDVYAADCEAHGVAPMAKGRWFADELRKLGFEVRDRGGKRGSEIHGLALSHADRPALRVVSSR